LKANPKAEASGVIIESRLDVGRGPVATLLVQRGTLRVGDAVVAGDAWGRVKALNDANGKRVKEAGPAVPVEILGFDKPPPAGEINLAAASNAIVVGFNVRPNAEAKSLAEREGVDIRTYRVIYQLTEDIQQALIGMLAPEQVEEVIGELEVRQTFKVSRLGTI